MFLLGTARSNKLKLYVRLVRNIMKEEKPATLKYVLTL